MEDEEDRGAGGNEGRSRGGGGSRSHWLESWLNRRPRPRPTESGCSGGTSCDRKRSRGGAASFSRPPSPGPHSVSGCTWPTQRCGSVLPSLEPLRPREVRAVGFSGAEDIGPGEHRQILIEGLTPEGVRPLFEVAEGRTPCRPGRPTLGAEGTPCVGLRRKPSL